jgi:hypothetical protein
MRQLHQSGRTFRVEKVPLCYMADFAWASTETRKIVKGEERIVHFLDAKQTVRQTDWEHRYARSCDVCSLRTICGGLFDRGDAYDPAELYPVFVDRDAIVESILRDPRDPSFAFRSLEAWREDFELRLTEARARHAQRGTTGVSAAEMSPSGAPAVGQVTEQGMRLFEAKRLVEGRKAERLGITLERPDVALGSPENQGQKP